MNNFCHNDLVFSFSQIYQIIIIWNNQRNIFHHHSQNQAKEKRPFKTSLPLRQSNAHPSQQNAPVRLICARTGPILSQIYRPIKLMFKKSVQTPFKIKMQFNSIKLFARFVFLGWLFNFISNLLLFNQTDYVLLYTVFTHFVLPPLDMIDLYKDSRTFRDSVMIGGIVTLIIALIGLLGYTSDETNRRGREIAIRKVNGATAWSILKMISKDISYIAIPAIVIGMTVAYYSGTGWLEKFTEKAPIGFFIFLAGAMMVYVLIIACVLYRAWAVSNSNPVDSLKSE